MLDQESGVQEMNGLSNGPLIQLLVSSSSNILGGWGTLGKHHIALIFAACILRPFLFSSLKYTMMIIQI